MPGNADGQIDDGEEFDVELHFSDSVNGSAVFSGYADIHFDPTHLEVVTNGITHDADYSAGTTGTVDNLTGLVDEVGGTDGLAPPPSTRVATIRFRAKSSGASTITTSAGQDLNSVIAVHAVNNINGISRDLRNIAAFGSLSINSPQPNDFRISAVEEAKAEGDSETTPFFFDVFRTGEDLSTSATIDYNVQGFVTRNFNDSAATVDDIVGDFTTSQVTFGANVGTARITVLANGDTVTEGNESFAVTISLPDGQEGTISDGFAAATILGDDQPPTVTRVNSSSTEITVEFSQPIAHTDLNIYDVENGSLGAADATLVLDAGGSGETAVPGSLVLEDSAVTFVPTGGPLSPGAYTLTLRSAANAFRSRFGDILLDGDADGTPGIDYVSEFTVQAPEAVVISIDDFSRGPGQSVNVPANIDGGGLPVKVTGAETINTLEFSVEFDPTLLDITSAVKGPDAPAASQLTVEAANPGFAVFTFDANGGTFTPPAGGAPFDLIRLSADVPDEAPDQASHVIRITSVNLNSGAPATADVAIHNVGLFGDADASSTYGANDVTPVLRNALQLDDSVLPYPLIDRDLIIDLDQSGTIQASDITISLQAALNLSPSQIPGPTGFTAISSATASVTIPTDLEGVVGDKVFVPVNISDSTGVFNTDLIVNYDTSVLDFVALNRGSVWTSNNLTGGASENDPGRLIIPVAQEVALPDGGTGSLGILEFDVLAGALVDANTPIDLESVLLNGSADNVAPAPVAGPDSNDGLVTFVPPPVFSFDFAPTGTTDFITSLNVAPNDAIVLDVYARNATVATTNFGSYTVDVDQSSAVLQSLITNFSDANSFPFTFPFGDDFTDLSIGYATFGAATATDEILLGTITLAAPSAVGTYNLTFDQATSALNPATGAISPAAFNDLAINVQNGVTPPDFALGNTVVTEAEGDSGVTEFAFTVTRSGDTSVADTIGFTIAGNGVNQADADDFESGLNPGTVNFQAGETEQTIRINVKGDLAFEPDEGFIVTLQTAPRSGTVSQATQTAVITNDESAALTVSIDLSSMSENGGMAFGTVTRNDGTSGALTVNLSSDDTGEATVPATVEIPDGAAGVTFPITAVDDALVDGTQTVTITSSLTGYVSGTDTIDVTDDESAALTVSIDLSSMSENGGMAFGTVTRNDGTSGALTVNLSSDDTGEATVPATVEIPDGAAGVTFPITAVDDALVDGTQTVTITSSLTGYVSGTDTIDVTDDESAALTVSIDLSSMSENGGMAFGTVTRNDGTSGALTVNLSSDDTGEATVPATVEIPDGAAGVTFPITAVDDVLVDGTQTVTITSSLTGYVSGTDTIDVTDDESAALTVSIDLSSMSENGGMAFGTVTRNDGTSGALTVNLSSDDTGEATVPATVEIPDGAAGVTFPITAVDDVLVDGTQTVTITSSLTGYVSGTDTIDVTDDESAALTVSIDLSSMSENGGMAFGTVTRNDGTSGALTVNLSSDDTGEATVPATVEIPDGAAGVTFPITAVDDVLVDGTQTVTITSSLTGYVSGTDTIDVTDDESAALTVSIDLSSMSENGGMAFGTVTRNDGTSGALTVNLSSDDTGEATVPATVEIPDGAAGVTFPITAVDDVLVDGTQTVTITSSLTGYVSGTDTIDVTDDESAALTVSIDLSSMSENGGMAFGTVTRNDGTSGALTVNLSSDDTGEATVPATVEIPDGAAGVTFPITAVDDALVDGTQTVTITSSLTGYVSGTDTIDVTDDESAALTVSIDLSSMSENGGMAFGTVTRNDGTSGALTVNLSSDDTGEATVPATVEIPDGAAGVTFPITAVDDVLVDGTQTVTITSSLTGYVSGTDTIDVTDDESAALTVSIDLSSMSENGGMAFGTVTRNDGTSGALTVNLSSDDTGEATVPATVEIPDGAAGVTFPITAVDDVLVDGTQTVTITSSLTGYVSGTDTIDVTDDESAALTVSIDLSSMSENGGMAFGTVTRNDGTSGALTVNLSSDDTGEATVPATVEIPDGAAGVTFPITAVDDVLVDGTQTVTITSSLTGYVSGTDTIDVTDDESAALTVSIDLSSMSENGGMAFGTVTRNDGTSGALTVNLSSDDTGEATVPATVEIPDGAAGVTFPITAVDDALVDGTQTVTITSSLTGYVSGTDTIDVTDDESAALTVSIDLSSMSENGGMAFGTVTRNDGTSGALTVNLSSDDTGEATVPATVEIPDGAAGVTFPITAVDDALVDGTQTVTITSSLTGYVSGTDTIDVTDDESAALTVSIDLSSMSENGGMAFGTVTRNDGTSGALTVNLSSDDTGEATVPATVEIPDGAAGVTFPITAVDDALVDGTQTVTITSSLTGYVSGTDTIDVTDDESAALTVSIDLSSMSENGGMAFGTVTRNDGTSGALTVNLSSDDTGEATVPATVEIPDGAAGVTFPITAVDDVLVDGTQTVTITSSLTGYVSGTDTIDVTDDESAALTVSIDLSSMSENGGMAFGTVTRNDGTSGALTVNLSSDDTGEATVPATVEIPDGAAGVTFPITAVDDVLVDGTQTVTITSSLTGYVSGTDTIDVTDDESAALTVSIDLSSMSENGGMAFGTVTRNDGTSGALTVNLSSDDTGEATVPATVEIPDGAAGVTFPITAVDDVLVDGTQTVTITSSLTGYVSGTDTIDVTDDEAPVPDTVGELRLSLRDLDGMPGISVGESFEIDVAFRDVVNDQPLFAGYADIVFDNTLFQVDGIDYDSDYGAGQGGTIDNVNGIVDEAGATSGSTGGPGGITGLNIFTLQVTAIGAGTTTITSDAGEDDVSEIVSFDIDNLPEDLRDRTDYGTLDITVLPAPELTVEVDLDSISENGGSTTGMVTRQGDLSQEVTVFLLSSDETELTVPPSVTILANQAMATFAVNAEDDDVFDGTKNVSISAFASVFGTDIVDIDVTDDETTTVSIDFGAHAFEAGEQDGLFQISLTTAADFDLTIPVSESGSAIAGIDYTDFGGEITIPAGQTDFTFMVDVIDDRVAELPDVLRVRLDDPMTDGASIDADAGEAGIFIIDNDVAGIQIDPVALTVSEDRTSSTFDVSLTSRPAEAVTLDVHVADSSEASIDLSTLTFDETDWHVPQTVTVSGEDDGEADGNVSSRITVDIQDRLIAPGLFRFAPPVEVDVTTLDNEPAAGPPILNSVTFFNHDADAERDLSPEGNGQRSLIRHIEVVIDGLVNIPTGPVTDSIVVLENLDTSTNVSLNIDSSTQTPNGQTVAVLSFLDGTAPGSNGLLIDGNYELRLDGSTIGVAADNGGVLSNTAEFEFHRLFGDSDGDRDVDARDIGNFQRAAFADPAQPSVYASVFDYNNDMILFRDIDDLMALRARFGDRLEP